MCKGSHCTVCTVCASHPETQVRKKRSHGWVEEKICYVLLLFVWLKAQKWSSPANSLAAWPPKGCKIHIHYVICWSHPILMLYIAGAITGASLSGIKRRPTSLNRKTKGSNKIWRGKMGWAYDWAGSSHRFYISNLTNNGEYWCSNHTV